uniref:RxLR effector candidate protein n=1 Tax=Peronospora matthiolae TaxID=2874970 RepID=A0AAV1TZL8_9STRA
MRLLDAVLLPGCIVFASISASLGARVLRGEKMTGPAGPPIRFDTAAGGGEEERSFRFLDVFLSRFGKSASTLKPSRKMAEAATSVAGLTRKVDDALEKRNAVWNQLTKSYEDIKATWKEPEALASFIGSRHYTEMVDSVVEASKPLGRKHQILAVEFFMKNTSQDDLMKMIDGALKSKDARIRGLGENFLTGMAEASYRHQVKLEKLNGKYRMFFEKAGEQWERKQGEKTLFGRIKTDPIIP